MSDLTSEQRGLRDALRDLLTKQSDSAAVRRATAEPKGYDEKLWRLLVEQIGVPALAVPEAFGGAGAGTREVQLALEELGRTLTPSPLLGSVVATALLRALGDDAAVARLLPRIVAGEVVALAWADATGQWGDGAFSADGDRLTGEAQYVLDGDSADVLLAVAEGAVYEIATGDAECEQTPAMDLTRRLARVRLTNTPGTRIGPLDGRSAMSAALDAADIALAGDQVGAAARALEMTVEYAKVRHQFGRPIGSFQALKHRMADLYVQLEAARSAAYAAAEQALSPQVARAYCSAAFQTIAAETIQLHGGIAITWEHDAHLYFKRAHGSALLFAHQTEDELP